MNHPVVMSIGGSDPSGGAGIQADIKAFTLLGVHGCTAITALTIQNTQQVTSSNAASTEAVEAQIDSLMQDLPITYVKTGLLVNKDIIQLISQKCQKHHWKLIVDPVIISTTGDSLVESDIVAAYQKILLPQALMVTPNIDEAEALSGRKIQSLSDMKDAAETIARYGPEYTLIKGGHMPNTQATDLLYDGRAFQSFTLPKLAEKHAHGSGCSLSALITGYLANQKTSTEAVAEAKQLLWQMIQQSYQPGKGVDVIYSYADVLYKKPPIMSTPEHFKIWDALQQEIQTICAHLPLSMVPEVGINIGYALPNPRTKKDICALSGRIIKTTHGVTPCGTLVFGGSDHIASIILAATRTYPRLRSALNIRYTPALLEQCKQTNLSIASFDRAHQPSSVDSTMDWGTSEALKNTNHPPDLIYDTGAIGKEPMIRILGSNPKDVISKLTNIINVQTD